MSGHSALLWQDAFPGMKLRVTHRELGEFLFNKAAIYGVNIVGVKIM